ncbi:MAG TPA: histidinol dehydrogenase [Deltaproteobacteria bacterium]|nr:MAG: histidinol dehydrogenase [Deltaproteobacteria bacterium GWA2_55_82]OGQ62285.1 MAG: histidinol dehydrogenase [Deltaproteobacteria bacterium RIFCSPLOWO2_02_FULL_55_12]OIJ74397.1 MAG: histidinol dehydrogenase [Deltaproteobacteria bacterium GWC2_55_46]HBG47046.1 histidinol dehydrogenase [Deltaproteobacteria bacterium]HCY10894.1 histidinol dehydrogenase [Deltaproteobacteria bacterium]
MRIVASKDKSFPSLLASILKRGDEDSSQAEEAVKEIIAAVRARGDEALVEYTRKFDRADVAGRLEVTEAEINKALRSVPEEEIALLELAASRIHSFHKGQVENSWFTTDKDGAILGSRITPLERAGIYVPGGKAAYPSTVLMNAIPARVAGVNEIIMATPPGRDGINPLVLAAAKISGVDRVFRVGGAHSIAALAYGTKSIPKVDKITGPGNIFVATAKRLVFGAVDIDMIAGPSEILIINDGSGDASWIAADLLSQAEHDELASSMLITTSAKMAKAVSAEVEKQLKRLKRKEIARTSIERYGIIIVAGGLEDAATISNNIAPEHLELFIERPFELLGLIKNAGAVFLGPYTPEAAGDYLAGPNHTLPTGGTARFSSPLGVYDFVKRMSVIGFSKDSFCKLGKSVKDFAMLEGLEAHGLSAAARLKRKK